MKTQALLIGLAACLAACNSMPQSEPGASSGPPGAPAPSDPSQELVDLQGCRWWVVVKPGGMEWQKMPGFRADCDGEAPAPATAAPAFEDVPEVEEPLPEASPGSVVTINDLERDLPEEAAAQEPTPEQEPEPKPEPEPTSQTSAVTAPAEPVFETTEDGRKLYIQAATFSTFANAQKSADKLRERGLPVLDVKEKPGLMPLVLGPFKTKAGREETLANLKRTGFADAYMLLR